MLQATKELLQKISKRVESGKLHGKDNIGLAVGKIINKHKVAKHFDIEVSDAAFSFVINQERVKLESALDGVYVIRTSLPRRVMAAETVVESYKKLSNVERAFRSLKTVDLHVRPIYHWAEDRVRAQRPAKPHDTPGHHLLP